ncbi:unnamed protein product [Knipowitschia caucasica]
MSQDNAGAAVTPPAVFAAMVKLPEFWTHDPEPWFQHVEAQFQLRGITTDITRYYHIVAALDSATTRRMMGLLRDPPHEGKYEALKRGLLQLYQLSDMERADRLLSLSGLGDCKPPVTRTGCFSLRMGLQDVVFLWIRERNAASYPPPRPTLLGNDGALRWMQLTGLPSAPLAPGF